VRTRLKDGMQLADDRKCRPINGPAHSGSRTPGVNVIPSGQDVFTVVDGLRYEHMFVYEIKGDGHGEVLLHDIRRAEACLPRQSKL
jgi:hypothetical protein